MLLFMFSAGLAQAQQGKGRIGGLVIDATTGEPLPGANVVLEGTQLGSSTSRRGVFMIKNVPTGEYTLRVSFIGYKKERKPVRVYADSIVVVKFALAIAPVQAREIIVTASRQAEDIKRAVVSASVMKRDEVVRRNTLRLDAVMETVPGVNLMGENVNIRNSSGYTRGLGSRVLILLDGVPVLISDFGAMNWDIIPASEIERVEVIKGPYSAIYGSFALGGVINIITRTPEEKGRYFFRATGGIYDKPYWPEWRWTDRTLNFNRQDLSYSKKVGNVGFRFSVGRHESTGDRQNRHFQRWNGTGKLIWTPNPNSELVLFGSYARDRRGEFVESRFDQPYLVPPDFLDYRLSLDAWAVYAHYRQLLSEKLELRIRGSFVRQLTGNQWQRPQDFAPAQGPGANVQLRSHLSASSDLAFGVEYKYDFAEQRQIGRHYAYTLSPYAQYIWEPSPVFRFSASLRYDYYRLLPSPEFQTQFRGPGETYTYVNPLPDGLEQQHWSPQLGLSYRLFSSTVLHAAAGMGIRIPALGERFLEFSQPLEFRPNPHILTEKSISLELGVRQDFGRHVQVEINGFATDYNNLIEPVYVQDVTNLYATLLNIPKARISGVEVATRFNAWNNRLFLNVSGTWTDPVITEGGGVADIPVRFQKGTLLSYRPQWIGFATAGLRLGPVRLEGDYAYASALAREQVQVYKDDQRVPKHQVDARLLINWQNLTLQFVVRNVLHYNYTQVERNMNEVRNFAVGLVVQN